MKVGDLVVQVVWEADGVGLVVGTHITTGVRCGGVATVLWPGGKLNMLLSDLEIVSENR